MDLVETIASMKKIAGLTDTPKEKQTSFSVSDVWFIWDLLVADYDNIETISLLLNFASDADLKSIVGGVLKHLKNDAAKLENMMLEFAIPMPERPPETMNTSIKLDDLSDKYIFRRVFTIVKELVPVYAGGFIYCQVPIPIKLFKNYLISHMELVDNLSVYGELKGYLELFPTYMPN